MNVYLDQLKSMQQLKFKETDTLNKKTVIKDGESDIVKVQESTLRQLTSIIKPKMTNDELRKNEKQASI